MPEDTTEENIQARIRGHVVDGAVNKFGSHRAHDRQQGELATGYCTLYGDMAGGFAVIKDLAKTTRLPVGALAQNDPMARASNRSFPSASLPGAQLTPLSPRTRRSSTWRPPDSPVTIRLRPSVVEGQ